jgi:hypothetical protein
VRRANPAKKLDLSARLYYDIPLKRIRGFSWNLLLVCMAQEKGQIVTQERGAYENCSRKRNHFLSGKISAAGKTGN